MRRVFSKGFLAGALVLAVLVALTLILAPNGAKAATVGTGARVIVQFSPGTSKVTMQADAAVSNGGAQLVRSVTTSSSKLVSFAVYGSDTLTTDELAQQFAGRADVVAVSPDYVRHAAMTPNDTLFGDLWGLENTGQTVNGVADADIDATTAWDTATGAGAVVAVIDTGVDYTHPDLHANMWVNPGEIPGDGIDNDGNGYIDDVYGIDASAGDSDPMDEYGHGTHTAGTIGAVGNNNSGVIGVAYGAKIMALRFLDANGLGSDSAAITCINYAIDMKLNHGVNIVAMNNSWGGPGYDLALSNAITAAGNAGIVFVAAAGNNGTNNDSSPKPFYPASYNNPNIISVGASTSSDLRASFSDYGATTVDIFAPGANIESTYPISKGAYYLLMSGTSMATPHVSGVIALVAQLHPSDSVATRISRVLASADHLAAFSGLCVTGGRLNAANAVAIGTPSVTSLAPSTGTTAGGTSVVITGTGFAALSGAAAVTFDGTTATSYKVNSSTQITAVAPAHAAGVANVLVTTVFGTSANTASDDYTYVQQFQESDAHISYGGVWARFATASASGAAYERAKTSGSAATIYFNGDKLDWIAMKGITTGKADVYLDGVFNATVDLSAAVATYQVNVWSTGMLPSGVHYVTISRNATNVAGKYITLDRLDVLGSLVYAPPSISSLSPALGATTGGTTVTINGSGFSGLSGASAVTFGGANATSYTVNSATKITAVAPAHAAGAVRVQVNAAGGATPDTAADDFTYVVPPTLTRVDATIANTAFVKKGTWTSYSTALAIGGSYLRSSTAGATMTITFNGEQLDWIATKGTTTGRADVYVDNVLVTTVNLAAATVAYQQKVFSTGILVAGTHTVKIVRRADNVAGKYITMDAVDVGGSLVP